MLAIVGSPTIPSALTRIVESIAGITLLKRITY
jgi:hypothetical protein